MVGEMEKLKPDVQTLKKGKYHDADAIGRR